MAVSTNMCHIDAYMRIYNAWKSKDKKGEGIDPQRSVVSFSSGESAKSNFEECLLLMITGMTKDDACLGIM